MNLADCKTLEDLKPFTVAETLFMVCCDGAIMVISNKPFTCVFNVDTDRLCFCVKFSDSHNRFYNVFATEEEAKDFSEQVVKKNLENRKSSLIEEKNRIELEICNINNKLKDMP
jgi:hypothetical protein